MQEKELGTKYLVIGNSAGGIGAAEAIREIDSRGSLTIVSEEPYPAYSRPLISEYLAGECSLERMLFRPSDFYAKRGVTLLLGKKVARLDWKERLVELEGGGDIYWDKLLLACGGLPFIPQIRGMERKGVFTFTTIDDARRIYQALNRASRAVVIGGGLIGLSVVEALTKWQAKVTIVELKDRVLSTILDETASRLVEKVLRGAGLELITGYTVQEIRGMPSESGAVRGVILDNGDEVHCDLVIVAIGVVPRLELVRGTEIKVNRGIVVDRYMSTSCPDVYACGDVAEAYDFVYETNRLTPIWPNAYIGGKVAGHNMAGVKKEYPGGTTMNSLKYFGFPIISAGIMDPPSSQGYEILSSAYGQSYRKIVLRHNLVVGMILVREIERAGIIFGLMKDKIEVEGFKKDLLNSEFGFASLPEEWRKQKVSFTKGESISPVALLSTESWTASE